MPDEPTTIFTLPARIDEIYDIVESIKQNYVTTDRFNQILKAGEEQTILFQGVSDQLAALAASINAFVPLIEAVIQGLNGVASAAVQEQELALLQQISRYVAPFRISLDIANMTSKRQSEPTASGP